jgi:hypothetical protein
MIPDIRIKYNGAKLRLVGFGFKKFHNLRLLEIGIKSIKERLSKAISEDDGPTKPLKKRYARYKSKRTKRRAVRDLNLTGEMLAEIIPRYADDRQAIGDTSTRKGRLKARVHSDLLRFSNADQATMLKTAETFFNEGVEQTVFSGRGPARAAASSRASLSNRRTYFGR